jgi:hypothetical protein
VDRTICYLNTDLDLTSSEDLTAMAAIFEAQGVFALHVTRGEDELWHATFEIMDRQTEPERNIAALVAIAESLVEPHRSVWQRCTQREFNIGYDCGTEPWAFNQGLSCELLGRMAGVGASLRLTIYPDREDSTQPHSPLQTGEE